ncbi:MAG: 30S ribosomal protein S12 methylthiotransferase RimO [Elusimicrobia bacterium]|nr:30S ribosomal protein S12 methylthiotransferase RimO [Elusimicrobiota bacterium]
MRAKSLKKNKVHVVTLGCSKNLFDSEVLMGQLRANKFEVEHEAGAGDAAVVVINTCGFVEDAKKESIDAILRWADAKKTGEIDKLLVTGCLSERYKEALERDIPEVDAYFGTHDLPRLLKTLGADYKKELVGERLLATPRHYAYLKISEGCDRPCSFCAIPLMRGKHVSRPLEELIGEARRLAAAGTRELLLIAQDSTYYGLDLYGQRRLADLLRALSDVDGIGWIRLHYAFPTGFPRDVLGAMAERPNVCKYLDMPLQHCADRLLASMRRGITRMETEALVHEIRDRVPGIALRTTLIAGYPGETQAEHDEMLSWVEKMRFDRLGVFPYSHEEDTTAFALADDVPAAEKKRRAEAVMEVQRAVSLTVNQAKVGRVLPVLVDRREGRRWIGRTEHDSPEVDNEVVIRSPQHDLAVGNFASVRVAAASEYDLTGEAFFIQTVV